MENNFVYTSKYRIGFLWAIALALGWVINMEIGFHLAPLINWNYVGIYACLFLVNGFFLGLFIGVFQFILLRKKVNLSIQWMASSTLVHAISFPISFLCLTILFWVTLGVPAIPENPSVILGMPLNLIMILSGTMVGIFQINLGIIAELTNNLRKKVLWILSNTLGWGCGFWVASYSLNFTNNTITASIACGLVIGIITGGTLILLLKGFKPA